MIAKVSVELKLILPFATADHRGVSNTQLAAEDKELADKYNNKSIAEQHSLDISWELFMQPQYEALRSCMFASEADLKRFRQVLVNVVLATGTKRHL